MGGGRTIRGEDAAALLREFCPEADAEAFASAVPDHAPFRSLADLLNACPADGLGVPEARLAALWSALFGEFE